MATTIGRLTEQIQRILTGGDATADNQITFAEIKLLVGQVTNKLLKIERFNVLINEGDYGVPSCSIATYDNIAVTTYKSKARSILPVIPMSLPRNMGVWAITTTTDLDDLFIPIPSGTFGLLKKINVEKDLLGQIGYEVDGLNVVYTSDIRSAPLNITTVCMKLLVVDPTALGDYDILPIPPEMEQDVITQVIQIFSTYQPKDDSVDNSNKK